MTKQDKTRRLSPPVLRRGNRFLPIAALAVLAVLPAFGRPAPRSRAIGPEIRLQGRVLRAGDRAPIAGARIIVPGTEADIRSDGDGRFELPVPEAAAAGDSEIRLTVSADGFETASLSVRAGDPEVTVVLSPSVLRPPRNERRRRRGGGPGPPGVRASLRRALHLPGRGPGGGIQRSVEGGFSRPRRIVRRRGIPFRPGDPRAGPQRVVLLVDGVRTAAIRTIGGHLGFIHPFAVGAVEVVKGPFSTLYGHDAMAGVIQVDTLRPEIRDGRVHAPRRRVRPVRVGGQEPQRRFLSRRRSPEGDVPGFLRPGGRGGLPDRRRRTSFPGRDSP